MCGCAGKWASGRLGGWGQGFVGGCSGFSVVGQPGALVGEWMWCGYSSPAFVWLCSFFLHPFSRAAVRSWGICELTSAWDGASGRSKRLVGGVAPLLSRGCVWLQPFLSWFSFLLSPSLPSSSYPVSHLPPASFSPCPLLPSLLLSPLPLPLVCAHRRLIGREHAHGQANRRTISRLCWRRGVCLCLLLCERVRLGCRLCLFWLCFALFGGRHGLGVYGLSRARVGMGAYACAPK